MIIRKANIYDSLGIAKVHIDVWKSSYVGIIDSGYLNELSLEKRKKSWMSQLNKGSLIYVAESKNGEIVGFATPCVERTNHKEYKGEISAIYVLDKYQGQGVGKDLLIKSAKALRNSNINSLIVWVLKDNPSCKFYESLNGVAKESKLIRIGEKDYVAIGYVWDDIDMLADYDED